MWIDVQGDLSISYHMHMWIVVQGDLSISYQHNIILLMRIRDNALE